MPAVLDRRSCLFHTITHYVTNQTNSQNAGALPEGEVCGVGLVSESDEGMGRVLK
jgi:hypothetical protein